MSGGNDKRSCLGLRVRALWYDPTNGTSAAYRDRRSSIGPGGIQGSWRERRWRQRLGPRPDDREMNAEGPRVFGIVARGSREGTLGLAAPWRGKLDLVRRGATYYWKEVRCLDVL